MVAAEARPATRVTAGRAIPGWLVIGGGVAATQVVALALFVGLTAPWQALPLLVGLGGAAVIMARPRLGLYVMAVVLIGQWPWNLSRYVGLIATVSALVWLLRSRRPVLPRSSILGLVLVYVILALLSAVSPATSLNITGGVLAAVSYLMLGWLCVVLVDSRQVALTLVRVMIAAGLVTALVGVAQAVTRFRWVASTYTLSPTALAVLGSSSVAAQPVGEYRIDSITGTPDYLGVTMLIIMPFMLCWLLRQRRTRGRLLGVMGLGLLGAVIVLSFARGAWVVTPISLLLALWMIDRKRVLPVMVAASLGLLVLMAWEPVRERTLTMIEFLVDPEAPGWEQEAGAWRLHIIPIAIEMILARPVLGVGIDQTPHNWPASAADLVPLTVPGLAPTVHNSYLGAAIEMGLGGLAVVLALVVLTTARLRWVAARFEDKGDVELASYARAAFAAFAGLAIGMLFYPLLSGFRYFWLLVGLTAALIRLERSTPHRWLRDRVSAVAGRRG